MVFQCFCNVLLCSVHFHGLKRNIKASKKLLKVCAEIGWNVDWCSLAYLELCPQDVKSITAIKQEVKSLYSSWNMFWRQWKLPFLAIAYDTVLTKIRLKRMRGLMWNVSRITVMFLSFRTDGLWANSVDPDQTAPSLIRVYTVCHSICTFWTHYFIVEPPCSNFRVSTANCLGVQNARIFTVRWKPEAHGPQCMPECTAIKA